MSQMPGTAPRKVVTAQKIVPMPMLPLPTPPPPPPRKVVPATFVRQAEPPPNPPPPPPPLPAPARKVVPATPISKVEITTPSSAPAPEAPAPEAPAATSGVAKTIKKKRAPSSKKPAAPNPAPEPEYNKIRVFNVKANMRIYYDFGDSGLDLSYIYENTKDVEDENFRVKLPSKGETPMVIFKYVPNNTTAMVYRGGSIVTAGSENTSAARQAISKIVDFIKQNAPGVPISMENYDSDFENEMQDPMNVSVMQAVVRAPFQINLFQLATSAAYSRFVEFEPERNAMAIWRGGGLGPNTTVNISVNGNVLFTCKGNEDANKERIEKLWFEVLLPKLELFKKQAV